MSQPSYRILGVDEVFKLQDEGMKIFSAPQPPAQRPREEAPEREHARLSEELFQLKFRAEDSERVVQNALDALKELDAKIEAKERSVTRRRRLNNPHAEEAADRTEHEVVELKIERSGLVEAHQRKSHLCDSAKRALKEWNEVNRERLAQLSELVKRV